MLILQKDTTPAEKVPGNTVEWKGSPSGTVDARAIDSLPRADASYRSSIHAAKSRFLDGTRVELFEELNDWAQGRADTFGPKRAYVLSGGAGTGKSTIASEFAKRMDGEGHLGASFLFVRGVEDLNSTRLLFSTLAYQLAHAQGTLYPHISQAAHSHLKRDRIQQLEYAFDNLFQVPLSKAPMDHRPVIIVVDALDECAEDAADVIPQMLQRLLRCLVSIPFDFRIFFSTRPEEHVEATLRDSEFADLVYVRSLHDLPRTWVDRDIRRFFDHNLPKIRSSKTLIRAYPDAAERLATLSDGLFVYARTALDFIGGYPDCPEERMQILLSDEVGIGLEPLDRLYLSVLLIAFPPDKYIKYPPACHRVRTILLSIALLRDHVSPRTLQALLRISTESSCALLGRLRAVVLFDTDSDVDSAIRPLHATFPQFLVDEQRCTHELYQVPRATGHHALALACLETLMGRERELPGLKRNMCELEDPTMLKAAITDLKERVSEKIPPAVRYACLHWAAHLAASDKEDTLHILVGDFVRTRMIFWIETLGYLDRLDIVIRALDGARAWYEVSIVTIWSFWPELDVRCNNLPGMGRRLQCSLSGLRDPQEAHGRD